MDNSAMLCPENDYLCGMLTMEVDPLRRAPGAFSAERQVSANVRVYPSTCEIAQNKPAFCLHITRKSYARN